jgi:hypothetical protein
LAPQIAVDAPLSAPQPHHAASEFEVMAERMRDEPRNSLACLMSVLQVPRWWAGSWSDDEYNEKKQLARISGGWRNARGDKQFLSFEQARQLISARVLELGLDEKVVNAYPTSHSTLAADAAWRNLSFERQMDGFRTSKGE